MTTLGSSGSSNTTSPRWGRSAEPGSAFSGLSRGRGRGRGGAGGSRGGRGRAHGGPSTRDSTRAEDDLCISKPDDSQSSASPSTKSSISPSASSPAPGKPNAPSSKSKPPSRRGSRAIPIAQINESWETTPAPAKSSQKRIRSQAGKPASRVPPQANLPTLTDNPPQSNKPRLSSESHTEALKDTPPHLNGRFDVRHDIDALVERVRAVAMDNRPSTPKSHIDWAVDDDDTLPDLDDWGVTTLTATQLEVISPIIVDGLRPLPDVAANSAVPSSLKQAKAAMVQPTIDAQSSSVNGITPDKVVSISPPSTDMKSKFSSEPMVKRDPRATMPLNSNMESLQPLHPSMPFKPLSVDSIVQHISKPRPRASPMRTVPKSPITSMMDLSGMPEKLPEANPEETDTQEAAEVTDTKAATRMPEPDLIILEPTITESVISNVSSDRGSPQNDQEPSSSDISGLGASMHAPKGIVDSLSAPANISVHTDPRIHDPIHTHTRAHTVGRSPFSDSTIQGQGDYMSRFTRSGHAAPRGGFQGNNHPRTHSTPPGGANHHRSPQTSRPVITGDAISKLVRTIGKAHNNP